MDNMGQMIANETYLLSETKLVTAEKRVIPSSMPGFLANRGPMAEHPLPKTNTQVITKKELMIQGGHMPRAKLETMIEDFS
jgi:hypothetical protein